MREGWTTASIGDVAERIRRINVSGEDLPPLSVTKDRGVVLQSDKYKKRIATDPKKYLVARPGEFVYDAMSLYYGAIGRVELDAPGLVSPDYVLFRIDESVMDAGFFQALVRSDRLHRQYTALAEGGNQQGKRRRIYWSVFESVRVPVPPLDEQRRIAAMVSSFDRVLSSGQAVAKSLDTVLDGLLDTFFSRPAAHATKIAPWGQIPAHWSILRCQELFDVQLGKMMSACARAGAYPVPYLRNQNVYWSRFDLSDVATMDIAPSERDRFRVRRGDILACEGRFIGRSAVWERDEPIYYQKALHRLRPRDHAMTAEFMQLFMEFRFRLRDDLGREARATSTIPHFPLERMVELPVPLPPRPEQDVLVGRAAALRRRAKAEREELSALANARAAVLDRLMRLPTASLSEEDTPLDCSSAMSHSDGPRWAHAEP